MVQYWSDRGCKQNDPTIIQLVMVIIPINKLREKKNWICCYKICSVNPALARETSYFSITFNNIGYNIVSDNVNYHDFSRKTYITDYRPQRLPRPALRCSHPSVSATFARWVWVHRLPVHSCHLKTLLWPNQSFTSTLLDLPTTTYV